MVLGCISFEVKYWENTSDHKFQHKKVTDVYILHLS